MTTPDPQRFDDAVLAAYEPMIRFMAKEIAAGPTLLRSDGARVDTSWIEEAPIEEVARWVGAALDAALDADDAPMSSLDPVPTNPVLASQPVIVVYLSDDRHPGHTVCSGERFIMTEEHPTIPRHLCPLCIHYSLRGCQRG